MSLRARVLQLRDCRLARKPATSRNLARDQEYLLHSGVGGGRTRTRTLDPLIKSQLLYQLSYAP